MKRLLVIAVSVGAVLAPGASATSGIRAPQVDLRVGQERQAGATVFEEWTQRSGPYCVTASGDGPAQYPRAMRLPGGANDGRFVLHTPLKPKRASIIAYAHPNDGTGQEIESVLSKRRNDEGEVVAWRASFSIALPPHAYIDFYAKWPPDECGPPRHVLERFHLAAKNEA